MHRFFDIWKLTKGVEDEKDIKEVKD